MDHKLTKAEPVADCTCYYHAPELHSEGGCRMVGCGCKWDGKLRPYAVQFGPGCQQSETFATFGEALAYLRGYNEARDEYSEPPRIVNTANIDQAEDAKPWAYAGLTEAEWDVLKEYE